TCPTSVELRQSHASKAQKNTGPQADHRPQSRESEISGNQRMARNTVMQRMMMQATMTMYSTAVGPSSETKKRLTLCRSFMSRPREFVGARAGISTALQT